MTNKAIKPLTQSQKPSLTPDQQNALSLDQHLVIQAGAGSGKTTVLIQRFLAILTKHPTKPLDHILAFTFTQKAALEMIQRIEKEITAIEKNHPLFKYKTGLLQQLPTANISTIHGFCHKILKLYPAQAELDPEFTLLEPQESTDLQLESIQRTLTQYQTDQSTALKSYIKIFSIKLLKKDLITCFQHYELIKSWLPIYNNHSLADCIANTTLNTLLSDLFPDSIDSITEHSTTKNAYAHLTHLLDIFSTCITTYTTLKTNSGKIDYNDLITRTKDCLKNPSVRTPLQYTLSYIMVDEVQDIDPDQWEIIQSLATPFKPSIPAPNLFLVGDIKQSIYSFRGAESQIFTKILDTFKHNPLTHTIIELSDNFRSQKPILDFINPFFTTIFQDHEITIPTQTLTAHRTPKTTEKHTTPPVQFQIHPTGTSPDAEIGLIINDITTQHTNKEIPWHNTAILTRRKSQLFQLEKVFQTTQIPFHIHSTEMAQSNTARLCLHLLKIIWFPEDNLAWLDILKSPLVGLSESDLYTLYRTTTGPTVIDRLHQYTLHQPTLIDTYPHQSTIQSLLNHHHNWQTHQHLLSPSKLIENALINTEAWSILHAPNQVAITSMQLTLDKIRHWETTQFSSRYTFIKYCEKNIINAQLTVDGAIEIVPNHINIMTIHASKGLEFPTVYLPFCHTQFNTGSSDRIVVSRECGIGLSFSEKKRQEDNKEKQEKNKLRDIVLTDIKNKTIAEEKRLFYVACTRAMDRLILSGKQPKHPTKPNAPKNYLDLILSHSELNSTESQLTFTLNNQPYTYPNTPIQDLNTSSQDTIEPLTHTQIQTTHTTSSNQPSPSLKKHLPNTTSTHPTHPNHYQITAKTQAAITGQCIHKAIQILNTHTQDPDTYIQTLLSTTPGLTDDSRNEIRHQLHLYKESTCYKTITEKATEIYHEYPLTITDPTTNQPIHNRCDTIIKYTVNDTPKYRIIDYKTTTVTKETSHQKALDYHPQLTQYAHALAQRLNCPVDSIEIEIYFTACGVSVV